MKKFDFWKFESSNLNFFPQKPVIVTAEQSFHGRTLAALTATAQPKYHKGFGYGGEMVPGFDNCKYNDIASLEAAVERATSDGKGLAAIMLEPLQGEGGIIPGDVDFFAKARELCDKHGALLMCDEVQAGMGRTGTLLVVASKRMETGAFGNAPNG